MKGRFWDDFHIFREENRGTVKASLFREIFYYRSNRVIKKRQPCGALFLTMYPNVGKVLRGEKGRSKEILPNRMMKLESEFFPDILRKYNLECLFTLLIKIRVLHHNIPNTFHTILRFLVYLVL